MQQVDQRAVDQLSSCGGTSCQSRSQPGPQPAGGLRRAGWALRWFLAAAVGSGLVQAAEQSLTPAVLAPAPAPAELALPPAGPPTLDLEQLAVAFGWNFDETRIQAEKIADGLYVLFGAGGNIAVSIGAQGTLMVDNQFPQLMPKIEAALGNLGNDGAVDFAINTHWHFDHAEGNLALGPKGTWLVAHEASRQRMLKDNLINLVSLKYNQPSYPEAARPTITFRDQMDFHFNGEQLTLMHFGPAHTTGDTAVYFKGANAIHMGDVFNAGYPFIDVDNGGDIDGMISFCEAVLLRIDDNTQVIPGHGPVQDRQALIDYIAMLRTLRNRLAAQINEGATLAEVLASKPSAELDERYGDPAMLLDRAYASLLRLRTRSLSPLPADPLPADPSGGAPAGVADSPTASSAGKE